jgi:hypothetical protein
MSLNILEISLLLSTYQAYQSTMPILPKDRLQKLHGSEFGVDVTAKLPNLIHLGHPLLLDLLEGSKHHIVRVFISAFEFI